MAYLLKLHRILVDVAPSTPVQCKKKIANTFLAICALVLNQIQVQNCNHTMLYKRSAMANRNCASRNIPKLPRF